jgi:hypothetical protein
LIFRKPLPNVEHPEMPADVVIVGGGPPEWPARCGFRSLIDEHNTRHPESPLSKENIYVLEKAREAGQHCLSGALLDPRSMKELLPGFENEAPLDAVVHKEAVHFLTRTGHYELPLTPPPLAGSRQLRHLDQPLREVAGRESRRKRASRFLPASPVRNCSTTAVASSACAPTTRASTSRTSRNRISSPATT